MFAHAPPPIRVDDGRVAVPIHIRNVAVSVVLDARGGVGQAEALMQYRLGPHTGCPLFDLRQEVDQVWIDGRSATRESVGSVDVGEGPYATIRVLDRPQSADSIHTIRLRYRLAVPRSDLGGTYPPVLASTGVGRVRWSFGMGDLFDGRHLEMWVPSNLPFDHFGVELRVKLVGASTDHMLITNGELTCGRADKWSVTFPEWFTSVSHMLELRPADEVEHVRTTVTLAPSSRPTTIDVWKPTHGAENLRHEAARIARALTVAAGQFGPYTHDRYTCFFHGADGGMEYVAGTTTSPGALTHEVVHSWFARGVMPARDVDGWWDEAFTTYIASGLPPAPLDFTAPPTELCSGRPFQRHTHPAAYTVGSKLFAGMAHTVGAEVLRRAMRRLHTSRAGRTLSTAELEQHLIADTRAVTIVDAFHRFVYGFDEPRRDCGVRFERLSATHAEHGRMLATAVVVNDPDAEICRHYVLVLSDPLGRIVSTAVGFDLPPGRSATLRMRLPAGPHGLTGAVHARLRHPSGHPSEFGARVVMRLNTVGAAVDSRSSTNSSPAHTKC